MAQVTYTAGGGTIVASGSVNNQTGANGGFQNTDGVALTITDVTINNTTGAPAADGIRATRSAFSSVGDGFQTAGTNTITAAAGGTGFYFLSTFGNNTGAGFGGTLNVTGLNGIVVDSQGAVFHGGAATFNLTAQANGSGSGLVLTSRNSCVCDVSLSGAFNATNFQYGADLSAVNSYIYFTTGSGGAITGVQGIRATAQNTELRIGSSISASSIGIGATASVGLVNVTATGAIVAPIGIDVTGTNGANVTTSGAGTINGAIYGIRSVVSAGTGNTVINVGAAIGGSSAPTTGVDARANGTSTGTVSITNTAAITASGNAIYTSSNATSGNVLNLNANVSGNGLAAVQAVGQGYTINVGAGATITSGTMNGRTILVQSGDAVLVNAGTISNTHASANSAVQFAQAATVTNTGTITTVGSGAGVVSNTGLTLTNSGTIAAGASGIYVGGSNAVSITNLSGGSITGNGGNNGTPAIALFNNGGGANTLDLRLGSTTGGVNSIAGGATTVTLAGAMTGNYFAAGGAGSTAFTLASTGSMQGASFGGADDTFTWQGGTIGGTIDAGGGTSDAFVSNLSGGSASLDMSKLSNFESYTHQSGTLTLTGNNNGTRGWVGSSGTTINVSGTIDNIATTSYAISMFNNPGSTVNILSGGVVSGTQSGIQFNGPALGTFTNSGTLSTTGTGIASVSGRLSITNNAGASIASSQYMGIFLATGGGVIGNDGTITGGTDATNSYALASANTTGVGNTALITNNATRTMTGGAGGISMTGAGSMTVTNSGTISGTNATSYGLNQTSGTLAITNNAGATIAGLTNGIRTTSGTITLTNDGRVGTGTVAAGVFTAGGTGAAVQLGSGGTVRNTGTIGGATYGIQSFAALDLRNTGTITGSGGLTATTVNSGTATILNSGTMSADSTLAIAALTGGTVVNAGTGALVGGADATYGYALQANSGTLSFTNYGSATSTVGRGVLNNGDAAMAVTLHAGSTTGSIQGGTGNDVVTLYTGRGTGDGAVVDGASGIVLQSAGTLAAAVVGNVDLGAGTNSVKLRGNGTGAAGNGAAGTFNLALVSGVTDLYHLDSGTWTLSGAAASGAMTIYQGNGTSTGTLNFTGTSGLTGNIYVNGGSIYAAQAGAFGSGNIHMVDPTVQFGAAGTYTNNFVLDVAAPANTDPTMFQSLAGGTITLSGSITTGTGNNANGQAIAANQYVTFDGSGANTFILTNAANNWTGVTEITTGQTLQGATTTISGGSIINNGALVFNQSADGIKAASISGSGTLSTTGTGIVTLSGANTYSGATTVAAGTLLASGGAAVGDTSAVSVASGATFQLGGNETVGSLSGSGTTRVLGNILTAGGDNSSTTFSGTITDQTPVAFVGSWTVSDGPAWSTNPPTYTGQEAAALLFGGVASTYRLSTAGASTASITDTAWYNRYGGGPNYVEAAANYRVDGGSPNYNLQGDTSAYVQDHTDPTRINYAFTGGVALGGGFTKTGTGTLTLTGTNTYTGITTINGGTLAIQNGAAIADVGRVDVGAAGTFSVLSSEAIGTLTGSGATTLGTRDLTLTAASGTYTGNMTGGRLYIDAGNWTYGGTRSGSTGSSVTIGGDAVTLNVASTGAIQGGQYLGLRITGVGDIVNNLGSITNTGTGGDSGYGAAIGVASISGTTTINNGSAVNSTATIAGQNAGINHIGSGGIVATGLLTVNNYGSITGNLYNGIENQGGSGALTVNNYTTGSIVGQGNGGGGNGIGMGGSGSLTLVNSGLIVGRTNGIATSGSVNITNSGMITPGTLSGGGSGTLAVSGAEGVVTTLGGSITNNAGGIISGSYNATAAALDYGNNAITSFGALTVSNSGKILGVVQGSASTNRNNGIYVQGATTLTNIGTRTSGTLTDGMILGGWVGAYLTGNATATTVNNSGLIQGNLFAGLSLQGSGGGTVNNDSGGEIRGAGRSGAGGILLDQGNWTINNASGALISNAATYGSAGTNAGIYARNAVATSNLTVNNTGIIEQTGLSNGAGIRVDNGGTTQITNNVGGLISGLATGVVVTAGTSTTVTNSGTIRGTATAVNSTGVVLLGAGSVTNNVGATISGDYRGVEIDGLGTVNNYGTITATRDNAISIYGGGTAINHVGGVLNATGAGGWGIYADSSVSTLDNRGTINAGSGLVSQFAGSSALNSGTITATSVGIYGSVGSLFVTNSGNVTGGAAVRLNAGGTVSNSGSLAGTAYGIRSLAAATITNSGTISGGTAAISLEGNFNDTVTLNTGSVITGAINLGDGNDTLNFNGGTVDGAISGGAGNDVFNVGLGAAGTASLNGATITGFEFQNHNSGTLTLTGSGSMDNSWLVANGAALVIAGQLDATNTLAVSLGGGSTLTVNAGASLSSSSNDAVATGGAVAINNNGSISGAGNAIGAFGGALTLNNSGTITGGTGSAINAGQGGTINNLSGGSIVAGSGGTAMTLDGSALYTVNLDSGSTVAGNIVSTGSGNRNVTIAGSLNGAYTSSGTGVDTITLNGGSMGSADLGAGDDVFTYISGTISGTIDGGLGNDSLLTNVSGSTLNLSNFLNFEIFGLTGIGTISGPSSSPSAAIYAGNGVQGGALTFTGTESNTGDIYVNGSTIRAATAGAFGTGTIHMIDPTAIFGATGTYANNISLEVVSPATNDPSTLSADAGVVATLTGAITQGSGGSIDAVQPLVIAGAGTIVLTNTANSWLGTTTIDSGATLQGTNATISGSGIVANGTLAYVQPLSGTVAQNISGTGTINVTGLGAGEALTFSGTNTVDQGIHILDGSAVINTGTLTAGSAVTMIGGSFTNNASVNGFVAYVGATTGSVTNTGTITGTVVNQGPGALTLANTGGTISGVNYGVSSLGGQLLVTNSGDMVGGFFGIFSNNAGDVITNTGRIVGGTIATPGGNSGVSLNLGGLINNQAGGLIAGATGIDSNAAFTLNNDAGATVSGGLAVNAQGFGTIVNAGTIASSGTDYAIGLNAGGTITNTGTITGGSDAGSGYGINATGPFTFVNGNGGTIGGTAGAILAFGQSNIDLQAGSTTNGRVALIDSTGNTVTIAGTFNGQLFAGGGGDTVTLVSTASLGASTLNGGLGTDTLNLTGVGNASLNMSNVSAFENRAMNGTGTWTLTGFDNMTGSWAINSGTLAVSGGSAINDMSAVTIAAPGTLQLLNNERIGSLSGVGNVAMGANSLTVGGGGTSSYAGVIAGSGNVIVTNNSTLVLSGANTFTGTAYAGTSGTLRLGASNVLADAATVRVDVGGALDLQGFSDTVQYATINGSLNGTGTLTAATYDLNGATVNGNLGTGTLRALSGVSVLNGSSAATLIDIETATLQLGASDRLADNAQLYVNQPGAVLDIGAFDDTVAGVLIRGTVNGTGTLTATTNGYSLYGATVNANLGTGAVLVQTGVSTLNGTAAATNVVVSDGTLRLGAANRLADTATVNISAAGQLDLQSFNDTVGSLTLAGTLNGTGTLTAANYSLTGGTANANLGAGTLSNISGASTLNGTSAANIVAIDAGTLSLGASDRLADTSTVSIASGATLNLGANSDTVAFAGLNGTLAGTGTLTAAQIELNGASVNANVAGAALVQVSGTSTLSGTASNTLVSVDGGTLSLGASNRIADTSNLAVLTGGTFNLGAFNDTVGIAALAGTLAGTGTLTATEYQLSGATVDANLGTGMLFNLSGVSTLNGTHAGSAVAVQGGTLRLGASDRLADAAALQVMMGATLDLGVFDETVGTAALAGTLAGTGTLNANIIDLSGATVNANLGTGTLVNSGGVSTLNGTSGAANISVSGGTLALGASDRLSDTATLAVASGATLDLAGFSDTVGLVGLGGTLAGTGTLTAGEYQLTGATVNANLGAGTLLALGGSSVLNGTSGAATVGVNAGTLALGASNRLADTATVVVANGATLNLNAFGDTVAMLALNGTLNGTGTLTAAEYQLNGAIVNGNLGAGNLFNLSGNSILNGTTAADLVNVQGGILSLGASNRMADTATLVIASGATLDLGGFNDTVAQAGISGTLAGTGTLNADLIQLNGATVNANVGGNTLINASGVSTLNGTANVTAIGVNAGTLRLGGSNLLADNAMAVVSVGAILDMGANSDTVATASINGTLAGTGTLTATQVQLGAATVDANLGGGTLINASGVSMLNGTSAAATVGIDGGTLRLGASNRLADTATVVVAAGATLDMGAFNDTVGLAGINGTLAGTGTLTAGEIQLNGATVNANLGAGNLFNVSGASVLNGTAASGAINVQGGTLTLGASERLANNAALAIGTGGTFSLLGYTETVGSLTNGAAGGGTLALGTGRLILAGNGDYGFSGQITGAGSLDHTGTGRLTLAGDFATTARLDASAGTLAFLGTSRGSVRVQGGTLIGGGTFGGSLNMTSGTLAPGGLLGTNNAVQPLGMFRADNMAISGGNLLFDFGGANLNFASDTIRISGNAALTGGTVSVNALSSTSQYNFSNQYVLVQAGTLTGTFANGATFANVASDPVLKWRLRYDLVANAVVLQVQKDIDFTAGIGTGNPNNAAVGQALNGAAGQASDQWSATLNEIAQLSPSQRAAAYETLNGEVNADSSTATIMSNNLFLDMLRHRMGDGGDKLSGTGFAQNTLGGVRVATRNADSLASRLMAGRSASDGQQGGAFWSQAYGGYQRLLGQAGKGQATLETSTAGLAMGAEGRLEDVVIGIAGGATELGADVDQRRSNLDGRIYQIGGYASYDDGVSFVSLAGNYYSGQFKTLRQINIGGALRPARARFDSDGYALSIAGGTRVDLGNGLRAIVSASATKTRDSRDGFTETAGGGLGLVVAAANRDLFTATGEVKLGQWIKTGAGYAMPYVTAGVRYNAGDLDTLGNMRFSGAPVGTGAFQVQGAHIEPFVGTYGAGIDVRASDKVSLGIAVENAYGARTREGRASMRIKIGF